ncbi:hypothetical protein DXV76_00520 [Rhodobacteraceae bacterium CCMM004]|nr:hypothetical protein DXV76_00520 [Rhodobacteraceae bacterium CCMM004]
MSRLVILAVVAAVTLWVVFGAALAVKGAVRAGARQVGGAEFGGRWVQRLSFVLLLALILYASIWGAG